MIYSFLHKAVSSVLILVLITLATAGFCRDAGAEGISVIQSAKAVHHSVPSLKSAKSSLFFTGGQDSDDGGRCDSCRYCACHAPLITSQVQFVYTPHVVDVIASSEPFKILPEVYLSKFTPPQNLV